MQRLTIYLLFSLLILFSGCAKKEEVKKSVIQAVPVKVARVEIKDMHRVLEYVGNIRAQDEAMVYPKVSGKIIEKVKIEGASINKGDAVVFIDRDETGFKFNKAPVESPLSGVVGKVLVDIGSNVSPQTAVALVVDMDKVRINLDIPEKYLPKVYLGQNALVRVDAYPEKEFSGKVTKISPVVDLDTRASYIEIAIDNPEHYLKSGMFAKVSLFIEEHKDVPVIFKEAILGKEPDNYVYVAEGNKVNIRKITLGIHQGSEYEVTSGLRKEELVVILGQQKLYDNAPVTIEMEGD
jgi:multidrug efflux pump subunit AcrA (membrane-fusion protein)